MENHAPVLMLTARDRIEDRVEGLNAGADDYLTKPFAFEEFLARVRALLRRKGDKKTTCLKVGDLELDQLTHRVRRSGRQIQLTSKEYSLLEYLMLHAGQVVTRTMISEHVWDESFDSFTASDATGLPVVDAVPARGSMPRAGGVPKGRPLTNIIDVYVRYLRNKIDKGFDKHLIHTLRGSGYILNDSPP